MDDESGEPVNTLGPVDACREGAARLTAVIRMLHAPYCDSLFHEGSPEEGGGPVLRQVVDGLRDIRSLLLAPVRAGADRGCAGK